MVCLIYVSATGTKQVPEPFTLLLFDPGRIADALLFSFCRTKMNGVSCSQLSTAIKC